MVQFKEPVTMGSGGCTRSYFGNLSVGGEGGGAIKIVLTGNLVVNG
ncbi:MAG: hypothetical protein UZ21_OP11001001186, partial [Microgenomates bacterium OLB22]